MNGYIKDYRQELESDIWMMPPLYHRTWQWLKYIVNHADNEIPMRDGTKLLIKRGQHLTSLRDIASGISWYEGRKKKEPNPKTIDCILKWMELTGMILIYRGQGNRQYTLITLVKYEEYQGELSHGNSKVTVDGEPSTQSVDINKNDKNEKKVKKEKINKIHYSEFVSLTEEEYQKLITEYGEDFTQEAINVLNSYKGANGKKYKSDYLAMLNWVMKRVRDDQAKIKPFQPRQQLRGPIKPAIPVVTDKPGTHRALTEEEMQAIIDKASGWEDKRTV